MRHMILAGGVTLVFLITGCSPEKLEKKTSEQSANQEKRDSNQIAAPDRLEDVLRDDPLFNAAKSPQAKDQLTAIAYYNRGIDWHNTDNYDKAIANYTEAIRLDPGYFLPYMARGSAWEQKGDYHKALADFEEALRLNPMHWPIHVRLSGVYATCPVARFRQGKRAIELADKACDLTHWKEGLCLSVLAAAYAEDGQFNEAVRWQEKAVTISEGEMKARFSEHLALYRQGKPLRMEKSKK